jgi:hypothetical protein
MLNRFLVLLSALTLTTGVARASSIEVDRYVPERDDSSEAMRRKQAVELMVGSYGYSVGLLFSDDRVLELGYSGLAVDRAGEGRIDEDDDRWSETLFVHGKFFHGNSFQTNWGLSWEDSGFGDQPLHRSERSVAFVDAALGNQWSWRHFTLGVDWVGVSVPVFERVRIKEDGSATDDGRKVRLATREWRGVDVHWLTLYAGVAF